ncbi:uncharacterized protein LOC106869663 isoform X2 [Octopus bimaculoides]|uniref:uncharacterized protein LOC106869663 isoform X2 n=1 Tax=Octopus bimaculoides TaxID=37653 RepID=UPI00071C9ED6|nr:uncharacterized protein LOC106869663 isoform X2 [Octopus bimaculoides]|eukprot:XP_014770968.1 PREDICTED: uncharacterized protein LOC106869663 isoform X1 [Octopus bimaculoides]
MVTNFDRRRRSCCFCLFSGVLVEPPFFSLSFSSPGIPSPTIVDMVFYELPQYVSSSSVYIALYLIFLQLLQHQTRSSSHWRLESKLGKVVLVDSEEDGGDSDSSSSSSGESEHEETEEIDQIMEILTTKLIDNEGRWSVNLHTQEIRDNNRKKKQSAWNVQFHDM